MPNMDRLYCDTNILIHLGEGTGEVSNLLYELVGSQLPAVEPFLCTSELSLAELLVRPYRQKNERVIRLYQNWLASGNPWLDVGPVNHQALYYAAIVRAQYTSIKLPDAIHLSTAIGFGCDYLLTADARLPDEIEILHERHGAAKGPARLSILRPEPSILRSIIETRPTA